jgi:hypothetical protein
MDETRWYWCLEHDAAVTDDDPCPPSRRLGPYPSQEAAENWRQSFAARNEKWDAEDREWEGDED